MLNPRRGESFVPTTQPICTEIVNFGIYLAPQIVGSLVGVIVGGVIVQRYWMSRANEATLINYLTKELDDVVDETLLYWSLDCSGDTKKDEETRQQARMLEQKIKGALHNLGSVLADYSQRYCKHVNFTKLMADVHDACMGGTFEGVKRPPDRGRYLKVVNTTHHVRAELFNRRV